MKSFLQLTEETDKTENPVVLGFGRMNPPTSGHMKLIDKVKHHADKLGAHHHVIVSHSQDTKKNPLSPDQKIKHLKRYAPGIHFDAADKEHPTILHHASKMHAHGHDHLVMVAGSDRVKEFHDLLHKYNGKKGVHGHFNFKKIEVKSAGHRDPDSEGTEGMSASKMREHAKNKDFSSFRQGVPSHVSDAHAKELMHDTRKGMGLNENVDRGLFKAIFVTGAPGSGKDIVLREAIPEMKMVEMNYSQILGVLGNKQKLAEQSNDFRSEVVRNRKPLIINGPADDTEHILQIKEELEELGYETIMIFVDTTNEVSKERNSSLSRMMVESIRHDKWVKAQQNKDMFIESFDMVYTFDNSIPYSENSEEYITDTYIITNEFLDSGDLSEDAIKWLKKNGKKTPIKHLKDNNSPFMQMQAKAGKIDKVTDGDIKSNGGYTFRAYHEQSQPTLIHNAVPKETKFSMDNNKEKTKKKNFTAAPKMQGKVEAPGVGAQYDTRRQGSVMPLGGIGEARSFTSWRNALKNESFNDPGNNEMGTMNNATNKEPMQVVQDKTGQDGPVIKKNKKKGK